MVGKITDLILIEAYWNALKKVDFMIFPNEINEKHIEFSFIF